MMIRAILVKAGCSTPIMEKEDVMDILRDNDIHQDVPFPFRRQKYVELGVLNHFKCKIAFFVYLHVVQLTPV
jgi:hypothetical protein